MKKIIVLISLICMPHQIITAVESSSFETLPKLVETQGIDSCIAGVFSDFPTDLHKLLKLGDKCGVHFNDVLNILRKIVKADVIIASIPTPFIGFIPIVGQIVIFTKSAMSILGSLGSLATVTGPKIYHLAKELESGIPEIEQLNKDINALPASLSQLQATEQGLPFTLKINDIVDNAIQHIAPIIQEFASAALNIIGSISNAVKSIGELLSETGVLDEVGLPITVITAIISYGSSILNWIQEAGLTVISDFAKMNKDFARALECVSCKTFDCTDATSASCKQCKATTCAA